MASAPAKKSPLAQLGPGLITGAADDDPSSVAAYSCETMSTALR